MHIQSCEEPRLERLPAPVGGQWVLRRLYGLQLLKLRMTVLALVDGLRLG